MKDQIELTIGEVEILIEHKLDKYYVIIEDIQLDNDHTIEYLRDVITETISRINKEQKN